VTHSSAVAMKEVAGCCKTDLHQTNEGDSCVGALCDGDRPTMQEIIKYMRMCHNFGS